MTYHIKFQKIKHLIVKRTRKLFLGCIGRLSLLLLFLVAKLVWTITCIRLGLCKLISTDVNRISNYRKAVEDYGEACEIIWHIYEVAKNTPVPD